MDSKDIWPLAKDAFSAWIDDRAPSMGAALAYYTLFSIAPLLLIVISIAGLFFGEEAARGEIFAQISGLTGREGAAAVQGLVESASKPTQGIAGTIIGIVVILVGATTVFNELQDDLDRIWIAPAKEKTGGIWALLRTRLLSFGMILGIGFLLMVSLVFHAALAALATWWNPLFGNWALLANVVNLFIGFVLTSAVFALIYKTMPRVSIHWRDVWMGAAVTAILFSIGKFLIGLYIGKAAVASSYGAAGSLVVFMVWVYYSAQIFLLGAEYTWVYARRFGSHMGEEVEEKTDAASHQKAG